jgi:glutamine amidotransferase
MSESASSALVIVDYGMGNLFSVLRACQSVGAEAVISNSRELIIDADGVILPGVGAFGVAMDNLAALDLIDVLRDVAATGKPLLGVCLGMQLLMSESDEFGRHRGLDLIPGDVVRLPVIPGSGGMSKVPHVGWESVEPPASLPGQNGSVGRWNGTVLDGLASGEYMYFVHSFYCRPRDRERELAMTRYGTFEFCSALMEGNVTGCQFHPERSGPAGLQVYRNFSAKVATVKQGEHRAGKS